MKRVMLNIKLSLKYWRIHKERFLTLLLVIVFGSAALTCVALLLRSEKNMVLDKELTLLGDYDVIVYELTEEQMDIIEQIPEVSQSGAYGNLGYVSLPDSTYKTPFFSYKDEISQDLYHMDCIRGHYPSEKYEIALEVETAKSLGISPYPGEKLELVLYDHELNAYTTATFTTSGIFSATASDVYGGWYRYPTVIDNSDYDMPGIILNQEWIEDFDDIRWTMYVQSEVSKKAALAGILACMYAIRPLTVKEPIELFQYSAWNFAKYNKIGRVKKKYKNWCGLLRDRISLHNMDIMFVSIIIMGMVTLGYTYFCALSERNNIELSNQIESSTLGFWDYAAQKTDNVFMYDFNVENRHDYGISPEIFLELKNNEAFSDGFGEIVNKSTRLTYSEGQLDDAQKKKLSSLSLRKYQEDDDTLQNALFEAESAMIEAMGFNKSDDIYSVPTIGLSDEIIKKFDECIIDGQLNKNLFENGEEIILVVPDSMKSLIGTLFWVGEELPLSDIVLDDQEEYLDFGNLSPGEVKSPVYYEHVVTEEGDEIELTSYSFGQRKDIHTVIGAIAVVEDEELIENYLIQTKDYLGTNASKIEYGLSVLCGKKSFVSWGLPDTLYTKIMMKAEKNIPVEQIDNEWYKVITGCSGVKSNSLSEIKEQIDKNTKGIMAIFFSIVSMLITVGVMSISISFYTQIRLKSTEFSYMRAVGMSLGQIIRYTLVQNLFYPFIGAILSIVPVSLCQLFFLYIRKKVESGAWMHLYEKGIPWFYYVPYRYNLFQYHIAAVMGLTFIGMIVVIVLSTIPPIMYLRKHSIVEEFDKSSF